MKTARPSLEILAGLTVAMFAACSTEAHSLTTTTATDSADLDASLDDSGPPLPEAEPTEFCYDEYCSRVIRLDLHTLEFIGWAFNGARWLETDELPYPGWDPARMPDSIGDYVYTLVSYTDDYASIGIGSALARQRLFYAAPWHEDGIDAPYVDEDAFAHPDVSEIERCVPVEADLLVGYNIDIYQWQAESQFDEYPVGELPRSTVQHVFDEVAGWCATGRLKRTYGGIAVVVFPWKFSDPKPLFEEFPLPPEPGEWVIVLMPIQTSPDQVVRPEMIP